MTLRHWVLFRMKLVDVCGMKEVGARFCFIVGGDAGRDPDCDSMPHLDSCSTIPGRIDHWECSVDGRQHH